MGKEELWSRFVVYNAYMRFAALLLAIFLLFPQASFAAEATFFGPIVPPECNCEPEGGITANGVTVARSAADFGCVLATVQNAMNLAVSISIIILLLMLVYAGFLFIVGADNPNNRETGRKMVTNAFFGLLVMLSGWLLVDFIMKTLYKPDASAGGVTLGPWNTILGADAPKCIQPTEVPEALPALIGVNAPSTGPRTGGSCTVPSDPGHPCSLESLRGTCFERHGADAAAVCNFESSGGQTDVPSGSDLLNSGRGPSYSWGLWQINLTTSVIIKSDGSRLNCHEAFTRRCEGENIRNQGRLGWCNSSIKEGKQDLYNACVNAAKDPRSNTLTACQLYREHGNSLNPWRHTALNVCHVPLR